MKIFLRLLFVLLILFSCNTEIKKTTKNNTNVIDSSELKVITKNIISYKGEVFEQFYKKFVSDSSFQNERISEKFKSIELDLYDSDIKIVKQLKDDYKFIDFRNDSLATKNEYDKYRITLEKYRDSILYRMLGIDNGIFITYKFVSINNKWYLISIVDEST